MVTDWSQQMAAAQAGKGAVYRCLLGEIAIWLERYYFRRLPPTMVEDAVQEALLAIHEKRSAYDPTCPFEPWVAAIARYKWIDRLRSMKASSTFPLDDEVPVPDHEDAVASAWLLERLLSELKPAQSDVVRMVKLYDLTIEEAAARTGQSVSLVKINIHRGLGRLTAMAIQQIDTE